MKQLKKKFGLISGLLIILSGSSYVWASHDHLNYDNPLAPWEKSGNKTIDFTNVDIVFTPGKLRRGDVDDSTFEVDTTSTSVFTLNSIDDAHVNTVFNGVLVIDVKISKRGIIVDGSTFSVYSTDALFGTDHTQDFDCNKSGRNCSTGQLVYGGDLTAFGWSEHDGFFEFEMMNVSGWAKDNWNGVSDTIEHVLFNIDCSTQSTSSPGVCFDVSETNTNKAFEATADGLAVVPEPVTVVATQ